MGLVDFKRIKWIFSGNWNSVKWIPKFIEKVFLSWKMQYYYLENPWCLKRKVLLCSHEHALVNKNAENSETCISVHLVLKLCENFEQGFT